MKINPYALKFDINKPEPKFLCSRCGKEKEFHEYRMNTDRIYESAKRVCIHCEQARRKFKLRVGQKVRAYDHDQAKTKRGVVADITDHVFTVRFPQGYKIAFSIRGYEMKDGEVEAVE